MDNLSTLMNVSRKFTIKDKVYTVKAFNLLQMANIRQKIIEGLKTSYKTDIIEMANAVPEKDRSKFIFDALKNKPYNEEEINAHMTSGVGISLILSAALHEPIEVVNQLVSEQTDNEELVHIFNFVLQIEEPNKENDAEKKVITAT